MFSRKNLSLFFLTVLASFLFPQVLFAETVMPFQDVPSGSYYYAPVQHALEKNIISTGKFFYPAKQMTRAEFIDWTVKTIGVTKVSPETPSFSDVSKTHWAYASIETGKKLGLVSGTQTADGKPTGKFEPGKLVIRAEAAVMIMKAFMQVKAESTMSFPDLKDVQWALDAIKKAATVGFFAGYPDKTFGPANKIIRAEGITVLMKVSSKLESKELALSFAPQTTTTSTSVKTYTAAELLTKVEAALPEAALPEAMVVNIKQAGNYAVFFAIPADEDEQKIGWYRLSLDETSQAEKFFATGFMGFKDGTVSADGKEFLGASSDGALVLFNIATLKKTELGTFTATDGERRYLDPVFTPDGKYIILFDRSHGGFDPQDGLLVVDAATKDIAAGTFVAGFTLCECGGALEKGYTFSSYTFLENNRVRFVGENILNLSTMTKE